MESDKWTGFNLRPINILVLSPRAACLVRVCLPFRRSRLSFAFSRAFATCVEHEVISCPPRDSPRPVFFYYPMTRKSERMSTEVSTITSCSRKQSYITTVVEMSEKNLFSSPENISRNYLCYKLQEWLSFV